MVQQITSAYSDKTAEAISEYQFQMAELIRGNLRQLVGRYSGKIPLGPHNIERANHVPEVNDHIFYLEDGHLYGEFPVRKGFFGLKTVRIKKEINVDEIPFEKYFRLALHEIGSKTEQVLNPLTSSIM